MTPAVDGLLLVDKVAGPTSHDVVARVRRAFPGTKAGHAGTLDPMATGLLPVALGRATRLIRFLPGEPKVYTGTLRLGVTTDTDDVTGATTATHRGAMPAADEVASRARALCGRLAQLPPAYSARRIGGVRMYRIARRGQPVEPRPAEVLVSRFDLAPTDDPAAWTFETEVSSGTYVRALARDLGAALGCGAVLASLRRTAIGPLGVHDAVPIPEPGADAWAELVARIIPLAGLPIDLPAVVLDAAGAARFAAGNEARITPSVGGPCRAFDPGGRLLGIGEASETGVRPSVVIAGPEPAALPDSTPLC